MSARPGAVALRPRFAAYDWGGDGARSFLRRWSREAPRRGPLAEAWFGAHPLRPSSTSDGAPFPAWLRRHGHAPPGFLVKILDVRRPLSLQVHPSAAQARAGFRREAAAGVPSAAPERLYKDRREKSEWLMAVTPFELFAGWSPSSRLRRDAAARRVLGRLPRGAADPLARAREILALPAATVRAVGRELERAAPPGRRGRWIKFLARRYARAGDAAALLAPLLAYRRLAPGRSVYLPAGAPHGYLSGVGLEVMGSSDNVLRMGWTSKTRSPAAALRALRAGARPRFPVSGRPFRAADFRVTPWRAGRAARPIAWGSPAMLLGWRGRARLTGGLDAGVPRGLALYLPRAGRGVLRAGPGGWRGLRVEGVSPRR